MYFVADESIDRQIVDRLREDGYQVFFIAEMEPGISDDEVLEIANREKSPLITADRDFGELIFRQRRVMSGIILARLVGISATRKAEIVSSVIRQHIMRLSDSFVVITPGVIRIRKNIE